MTLHLANWFGISSQQGQTVGKNSEIALRNFVDFDLDIAGLYARGHHDHHQFAAAVKKLEPHADFSIDNVKQAWATFHHHEFTMLDSRSNGAVPITVIDFRS